jgi:predicted AAA+ superfamily ATPase
MGEHSTSRIVGELLQAVEESTQGYYRLVLLVGPARSGKTTALRALTERLHTQVLNLSFRLSRELLQLTRRQRRNAVQALVADLVQKDPETTTVAIDNIELLFDPQLAVDPLRLLQGISRNRNVVAAWPGDYLNSVLSYASPEHPEHRRYRDPDARIIQIEDEEMMHSMRHA